MSINGGKSFMTWMLNDKAPVGRVVLIGVQSSGSVTLAHEYRLPVQVVPYNMDHSKHLRLKRRYFAV